MRRAPVRRLALGAARRWLSSSGAAAVHVETKSNGVAVVSLARPSSFNAMTVEMGELFEKTMHEFRGSQSVKAVVLTGQGKAFSAGGDLNFLLARSKDSPSNNREAMRRFYARFLSLRELHVPIVAAINGPAIGAGACVAVACDMRVAHPAADIGFTFLKLGLHPGMGVTHTLPQLVRPDVASRLLLTGEVVRDEKAKELGLVTELSETPVERALEIANTIAELPPAGVRSLVSTLRSQHDQQLNDALWREADRQAVCYASPEFAEQVNAMLAKNASKKKQ